MTVRKTHTKSRRGCLACKRRHVKCDETKPRCAPCNRLDLDCTWPNPGGSASGEGVGQNASPTPSPSWSSNIPNTPDPHQHPSSEPPDLAIADLKLLHFWTLNTSLTCTSQTTLHTYQSVLVELGFKFPYLLRGILALSALHRATVYPSERKELMFKSSEHYDAAISAYLDALKNPDPATCAPVFALSGILYMHQLGMAQVQRPEDPIAAICSWIQVVRGVRAMIVPHWQRLIASEVAPIIAGAQGRGDIDKTVRTEVMQLMDMIDEHIENPEHRTSYVEAVNALNAIFVELRAFGERPPQDAVGLLMAWLASGVDERFVELLFAREQCTLVLMAYFAVLFQVKQSSWFIRGWPTWTLECVERQLSEELWKWIEWPRTMIRSE
ncbi:hypothetical protein CERZMDRAFT_35456 [Cercospora zeae-maydis SCOH1-5]|uniref:Zn(2)-C6 fungal-type domain-containing protein n=1 Tax=Cercospora zeae-maydis SCOH1-5 TaxID=717836 RepID=A0A6A6FNS5_9PEZI|nr:hypothetical protein CERZMDRAFT_35456 [Cercospora zeae-maydis SCOH1-5]